jgi:hypothetical protein
MYYRGNAKFQFGQREKKDTKQADSIDALAKKKRRVSDRSVVVPMEVVRCCGAAAGDRRCSGCSARVQVGLVRRW